MIDVQGITEKVVDEVMNRLVPQKGQDQDMQTLIVQTSADVTARILQEYQRQDRIGWPVH